MDSPNPSVPSADESAEIQVGRFLRKRARKDAADGTKSADVSAPPSPGPRVVV